MRVPRTDGLRPDRYVEIDLDWFEPHGSAQQATVAEFVERTAPLWRGRRGECGVILNPAFLVDVVTEFGGELDQRLPMRTARYVRWRDATYADLGRLAAGLRAEATRAGVPGLRVGLFVAGVGRVITGSDIYDLESDWCDRHPELYPFDLSPLPGPTWTRAFRCAPTATATPPSRRGSRRAPASPTSSQGSGPRSPRHAASTSSISATASGARCSTRGAAPTA
jgi:hypothetical protein